MPKSRRSTVIDACASAWLPPTVPAWTSREVTALDARTTRHAGYGVSQRLRKRIEEVFGWLKTVGLCRQTRFRGRARVGWMFTFAVAAYNLVRLRNLRAVAV